MAESAGTNLERRFGVKNIRVGLPVGIRETDAFFEALTELTGVPTPARYANERGRLVDAYVDGHKYVAGKRAIVYGEEDMVIAMFTWEGAVLAAAVVAFPLVYRSARAAFEGVDQNLENAARTLGATETAIFFRVSLPLALRGLLAGVMILIFVLI